MFLFYMFFGLFSNTTHTFYIINKYCIIVINGAFLINEYRFARGSETYTYYSSITNVLLPTFIYSNPSLRTREHMIPVYQMTHEVCVHKLGYILTRMDFVVKDIPS